VYVARQPILDRGEKLYGYELLFRDGPTNAFTAGTSLDAAASSVITDALATFDLDGLVGQARAFFNVTEAILMRELFLALPHERVVLELLEGVRPTPEVLRACRRARGAGYTLALDDFVLDPEHEPLLDVASLVKVDFRTTKPDDLALLADAARMRHLELVAEKVESAEEVRRALDLGYSYFQGFYFFRPEMLETTEVPPSALSRVRLLAEINAAEVDFERIGEAVRSDVALVVKLLKYINSAALGLRSRVQSVRQAITVLGEQAFRRWVALVTLATMTEGAPPELLQSTLVRAAFCERLGRAAQLPGDLDYFLVGILSSIDAVLRRPMLSVIGSLGVAPAVSSVLLTAAKVRDGELRARQESPPVALLVLVRAWERADWAGVDVHRAPLGLELAQVAAAYREALRWASETMQIEAV
jgi:EAL and modified HD-GYP domain-containing signal transduction protein